ncbi:MAG: hypothetical protein ACREMZ_07240 [Gemmatimonadales bacterium]
MSTLLGLRLNFRTCGMALALGATCAACARPKDRTQPSPLPAGCPSDTPPSTTAQLQACLTVLDFDTVEAVGDEQVLTVIEKRKGSPCPGSTDSTPSCRYGPRATIEPEIHSHQHQLSDLNEGRIIARLSLAADQTEGYEKLSVVNGHPTYWWVQLAPRTEADLKRKYLENREEEGSYSRKVPFGRSVFVSAVPGEGGGLVMKEYPLDYTPHHGRFKQALARWVWDPEDEKTQGSCGQGCCR